MGPSVAKTYYKIFSLVGAVFLLFVVIVSAVIFVFYIITRINLT